MIEVTCGACGTTQRFAESDVPPGGRTTTCTACKAKLVVPGSGAAAKKAPLVAGPSLAAFDAPEVSGGTGDVIDLADLPAPKRASPLAGAAGAPGKNAPRTALSDAKPGSAIDLGDINLGLDLIPPGEGPSTTDLPAPVGPKPSKPSTAAPMKLPPITPPRPSAGAMTKQGIGPGIRPGSVDRSTPPSIPSIPVKPPSNVTDLPAPKRASTPAAGVTPPSFAAQGGLADLPAPKRAGSGPAPAIPGAGPPGITDLPAPKRAVGGPAPARPDNLPVPKRSSGPEAPPPRGPSGGGGGGIDLPAPKGFFDDLPAPVGPTGKDVSDLPAPKGFFDDLPGPVSSAHHGKGAADLPAPKGFFDDLPGPATAHHAPASTELAPKGFFDDLPGPGPAPGAPISTELAPKGFFDDATPPPPAKGFFDDIPVPTATIKSGDTLRPGKALDLDDLELAPHSQVGMLPTAPEQLDLEPPVIIAAPPPVLQRKPQQTAPPPSGRNVPALELPDASGDPYGGLDLPPPTPGARITANAPAPEAPAPTQGNVVSFKPSQREPEPMLSGPPSAGSLDLDIESAAARARVQPSGKPVARKDKDRDSGAAAAVEKEPMSSRTKTIAMVSALVVVAGSAGGFFMYKRWKKQKHAGEQLEASLQVARSELASGAPHHWDRAAAAANTVLAIESKNPDALAISAEASFAAILDEGTDAKQRADLGNQRITVLTGSAATGPDVDKALALKTLVEGQADRAAQRLESVLKAAPSDADALLFMGWAHLGAHQWKLAVEDFDRALKAAPARDVPALYGRAQAKLAIGDREGAVADFDGVLKKEHDHVGAQVGQAAATPASQFEVRDQQLAALLARKDIGKADPRAVAMAWTLWGDDARVAGRLDAAGERYKRALELDPQDQSALVGQADVALRSGRADVARELVDRALAADENDVGANLLAAQIDLERKQIDDAMKRLDALAQRQPPIEAAIHKARLLLLTGKGLEAQGKLDDALTSYIASAKAAGDRDVAPTIAAVQLLGARAAAADKAKDARSAAGFRQQSEDLLAPLAAKAQNDPAMAVTLGVAYLQTGAPERAEPFLAAAVAARPKDVEALFQLAEAQARQGKRVESLATRQKAFDVDPTRADVGLALAREYEQAGQDGPAGTMYEKLVASPDVTIDVRARAGRFWARTGDFTRARAQGIEILKSEPDNAAGLYLQAEGLLAEGKLDLARRTFQKACDYDAQAQYYDGLGRANEAMWRSTEDTRFQEDALRAYGRAADLDPKMFTSQLGRGRLMIERNDFARALDPLNAARALQPNDPDVAYFLGVALHGVKREKDAAAWLIKANQLEPRAEAYELLGEIYGNNDQPGPAAQSFARAVELAMDQEKKTGQQVPWLTDTLYQFWVIETARDDRAGIKRVGNLFLNRNPRNPTQVDEVRRSLLSLGP